MIYGYARVSTIDQNEERQLIALKEKGVEEANIYVDKQSGKDFDRKMYKRMFRKLKKDDVLYILSIDRLGRSYEDVQNQWRLLTKKKKIDIVVIDMPLLDTRTSKDLMGTFIADLVLQILSFVAESERKSIKERQRQGIEAAKARGVRFGRPSVDICDSDFANYESGGVLLNELLIKYRIHQSTFYRKLGNYRARKKTL